MPRKIIDDKLKQEIIDFYKSKPMSLKEVGTKFELSPPTVIKILKDIPKYSKAKINNPNLIEDFFKEINTEEKAYFLGLIISDGNVFKDETSGRQASISITLDLNDEYMLNTFKQVLQANTTVGKDGRGCGTLAVRSNIMAQDLAQYGVVPRKSYITYLPTNIEKQYMSHLIRGILDGDGNIQAKLNKDNRFLHSISFCGSHKLMEDISNYCANELQLNVKPQVYDYQDRELSEIKLQNIHDIQLFGDWIYNNATIYLKRKYETYLAFKQHYNLD